MTWWQLALTAGIINACLLKIAFEIVRIRKNLEQK